MIYHPFIKHIRQTKYGWTGEDGDIVPDYLRAVSWMDGANGQIKEITQEEKMMLENELKITCCKHSAARTAVEQAADTGPMFKVMKKLVKDMDPPNASSNSIYHFLDTKLNELATSPVSLGKVIKLPFHKLKAILVTVAKLPTVSGQSH